MVTQDTTGTGEERLLLSETNERADIPVEVVVVASILVLGAVFHLLQQPTQIEILR